MNSEITDDMNKVNAKLTSLSSTHIRTSTQNQGQDITMNVVIRNLQESSHENTASKVNALFREGLNVTNIQVDSADRKSSHDSTKPGLIIARMQSKYDNNKILNGKYKLKNTRQYSSAYINHDQTPTERSMSKNVRTILNAMKGRDANLSMRGSLVRFCHSLP